eukprot:m.96294 g.96294  ORF g.96294 m.96294 type:complete len:675 (+) comp36906_c0_seq2:68-2092(+)
MLMSEGQPDKEGSLQEAFLRFRKAKQERIRIALQAKRKEDEMRSDPQKMEKLRKKFLEQAKQYLGVPYAKKFHEPGSPDYDAPLFLDCCALVRRVLRDLKEDFGFTVGPWNQAYQFDSLPLKVETEADMKPGDLVFISGTYFNPKSKKHPHDMVHIEIWLGDGEKTIGARWHRGRYCSDHPWRAVKYLPGKNSVFAVDEEDESADGDGGDGEVCDGSAGDTPAPSEARSPPDKKQEDEPPSKAKGSESNKDGNESKSSKKKESQVKVAAKRQGKPNQTFFIGGGNGVALVETPLVARGWQRIFDNSSRSFKLKWVELKSQIDYLNFREGEQLVNHIPNINLLTTKIGLLDSLRDYCRGGAGVAKPLELSDFFPETYKVDFKAEREAFLSVFQEGDVWICKPTAMNQGKGIFLVRELEKFRPELDDHEKATKAGRRTRLSSRIIQRYIRCPLLLEGRKFDIRTYLLIAHTTPYFVLYHHGYVRLSCQPYSLGAESMAAHLTNQYVQKKDPLYGEKKEDTVWSFEQMQAYLNSEYPEKGIASDWMSNAFTKQMQKIMMKCFYSVKHKLKCQLGFFELLGFDFMIDSDMKVYLIEININPALHTNCSGLKQVIPPMIEETLDLSIELFEKSRQRRPLMPLESARNFQLLYHEAGSSSKRDQRRPSPAKTKFTPKKEN